MRSDALKRRNALLRAARDVFVERGYDAPLDAVAARADVGIATLYRNFSSRDELAHAVAESTLLEVGERGREALERFDSDPDSAWLQFIDSVIALQIGTLVPALVRESFEELPEPVLAIREQTKTVVTTLIRRVQSAGIVRDDLAPLEIVFALATLTRPQVQFVENPLPNFTRRLVAIYLAGIRPGTATLPEPGVVPVDL